MTERTLHLIDIENLAGTGDLNMDLARRTANAYRGAAGMVCGDLAVVACSHHSGFAVAAAFPDASVRWRSGANGADLALLDAAEELPLHRFDRLVVGSGDGIFAELVQSARQWGLRVVVVSRGRFMSHALRMAATTTENFAVAA